MSLKRITIDGFGQLELNNVFFRREGAIEAQCALDTEYFATEGKATESKGYCENGMLVAVDKANGLVKLNTEGPYPFALVYSTEHMYDERANSLKDFYLPAGTFYPRLGYIKRGEIFTTNCLCYDDSEEIDGVKLTEEKVIELLENCGDTPLFGIPSNIGAIKLTIAVEESADSLMPILKVVKKTTMPNGTLGVKFQVIK